MVIVVEPPEQIGLVVAVAIPPTLVGSTVTVATLLLAAGQPKLVTVT